VYTLAEVGLHKSRASCWVAIRRHVYDFTSFLELHPCGARELLRHAGTDASDVCAEFHSQSIFGEKDQFELVVRHVTSV
jgi:L-lactate dehydrogenase (cytochrome)